MRTIKFRGQCAPDSQYAGNWVEGSLVVCEDDSALIVQALNDHNSMTYHVKPESVGEWSSLYDYSTPKKRIFEGDILAHVKDPHLEMYEVYYKTSAAAFFARSVRIEGKEEPLVAVLSCPWWVVCGNLIDNPELLLEKEV